MSDWGWVIQAVLYLNVFIIGVLLTIGIQHWRAHRNPDKSTTEPARMLPTNVREEIVTDARKHYQRAVYKTAVELDKSLAATNTKLKKSLEDLRQSLTAQESERYQTILDEIRRETTTAVGGAADEIAQHQAALRQHFRDHQAELDQSLEREADKTSKELMKQREDLAKRQAAFEAQMAKTQAALQAAFQKRQAALTQTQTDIESQLINTQQQHLQRQATLDSQLDTQVAQRRDQLLAQLDANAADVILGFLEDVLGSSAPSGAEAASLTALLDEHKDDLLASIRGDTP